MNFRFTKSLVCFVLLLTGVFSLKAQTTENALLLKQADSLMKFNNYELAAITFAKAFRVNGGKGYATDKYNAACAWALSNYADSAFVYLNNIVKYGYRNYHEIKNDKDLKPLHDVS